GDLGEDSSDDHVSQRDSLAGSNAARDHAAAQEKAAAAAPVTVDANADPFQAMSEASASELVAIMEEHPSRVEAIQAFEVATRGDNARKTIMEFEAPSDEGDAGDSGAG